MKIHEKTKAGFLEKASTPFKLQGKYRGHLGKFRHRGAISRSAQLSGGLKKKVEDARREFAGSTCARRIDGYVEMRIRGMHCS